MESLKRTNYSVRVSCFLLLKQSFLCNHQWTEDAKGELNGTIQDHYEIHTGSRLFSTTVYASQSRQVLSRYAPNKNLF